MLLRASRWTPIIPAENKYETSDTNITLPQSAISLVGFLSACICHLLVFRLGPVRGYLRRRLQRSSHLTNSQKVKSC